jgi:hypothetical protein
MIRDLQLKSEVPFLSHIHGLLIVVQTNLKGGAVLGVSYEDIAQRNPGAVLVGVVGRADGKVHVY